MQEDQVVPTNYAGSIAPHGGALINRELTGAAREAALERSRSLPSLVLGPTTISDLELLAIGGFSPLTGFLTSADYRSSLTDMHLTSGVVWPIPVTLAVSSDEAKPLREGKEVALCEPGGRVLAILTLSEKFGYDREHEAQQRLPHDREQASRRGAALCPGRRAAGRRRGRGQSPGRRHLPAVSLRAGADTGHVRRARLEAHRRLPDAQPHPPRPRVHPEVRAGDRGRSVLQPAGRRDEERRHPGQRAHAELREAACRLLSRPIACMLGVLPAAMRYAGPREAIFHAIMRKNYGCTHFIVGRDHAGVGNYYGTYDAQHIFDEFKPGELGITPLFFDNTFYCQRCGGMASAKTCPHDASQPRHLQRHQGARDAEPGRGAAAGVHPARGGRGADCRHAQESAEEQAQRVAKKQPRVLVIGLDCADAAAWSSTSGWTSCPPCKQAGPGRAVGHGCSRPSPASPCRPGCP